MEGVDHVGGEEGDGDVGEDVEREDAGEEADEGDVAQQFENTVGFFKRSAELV